MATRNILASGTGAGTSSTVTVKDRPITLSAFGTFGTDSGAIQKLASNGTTWEAYVKDGTAQVLDADTTAVNIYGGGSYRVVFTGRTGVIGVDLDEAPIA
jgi:hypothetical protein